MKHNEHMKVWLGALRDEATRPECELKRIIEIAGIIAQYASGIARASPCKRSMTNTNNPPP